MKIHVSRFIRDGIYYVGFASADVTQDEAIQFQKFGTPRISTRFGSPGARNPYPQALSDLRPNITAGFTNEQEAKNYEAEILSEIRTQMEILKNKKDEFTSTSEVEF
jgi:hypothetical protein